MTEISEQALARKKRFLELKEKSGNIRGLIRDKAQRPWRVWFDESGKIITCTQSHLEPKEGWYTYNFEQDQLKILQKEDLTPYVIVEDAKTKGVYHIETRKLESYELNADNQFLYQIQDSRNPTVEVVCTLTKDSFKVELGKSVIEEYIDIKPQLAKRGTHSSLIFYFTYPDDPHILFQEFKLTLEELLTNNVCTIPLEHNYLGCGVFTRKIFNSYMLKEVRE